MVIGAGKVSAWCRCMAAALHLFPPGCQRPMGTGCLVVCCMHGSEPPGADAAWLNHHFGPTSGCRASPLPPSTPTPFPPACPAPLHRNIVLGKWDADISRFLTEEECLGGWRGLLLSRCPCRAAAAATAARHRCRGQGARCSRLLLAQRTFFAHTHRSGHTCCLDACSGGAAGQGGHCA